MNAPQNPGLPLPRCCAHLVTWRDGPPTARTPAVAARPGRTAETQAPEPAATAGSPVRRLSGSRVVCT
ncbi:hypothetical protein [Streptomyces sp. AK04-3B]|uniref:hypothetical protein n=1 Tax=unclassified Streptomyces TaxID=2593676 RepID=UPI0029BDA5DD|nr:hypothetical protein [Streptomyces sp. AK04-3B]MDX3800436.1 hypothetical protein [Streptomyces sp. AK04-3B]